MTSSIQWLSDASKRLVIVIEIVLFSSPIFARALIMVRSGAGNVSGDVIGFWKLQVAQITRKEIDMHKARYKFTVASVLLLFGGHAVAGGGINNTTITHVEAESNGNFFVYVAQNISGSASCASQPATGFVVDGTTEAGKILVALVQTAYALGKTVSVGGLGTCNVHAGYEDLGDFYTTN